MKHYLVVLVISCLLISCGLSEEEQQKREQEVADSVAKMLTGKSISDPSNTKKIEKFKNNSPANTPNAIALKNISLEYDYDNKLFNKRSDVDGKLYNRSRETTYKNIQLKVVCKDKEGNITESFTHTVYVTLHPNAIHKFTIRFNDSGKTRNASVYVVGAAEV